MRQKIKNKKRMLFFVSIIVLLITITGFSFYSMSSKEGEKKSIIENKEKKKDKKKEKNEKEEKTEKMEEEDKLEVN